MMRYLSSKEEIIKKGDTVALMVNGRVCVPKTPAELESRIGQVYDVVEGEDENDIWVAENKSYPIWKGKGV